MNLDDLQSVQARERQSSELQHLRATFYREASDFIQGLMDERARKVEQAENPFSEPEISQLSDDIETAEQTVEAIYERRVGKVVKKASIAAAGMPVDDDGLTDEERDLFEDLVSRIEQNRETILAVLDNSTVSDEFESDADHQSGSKNDAATSASAADTETASQQDDSESASSTGESADVPVADVMGDAPSQNAASGSDTAASDSSAADPGATQSAEAPPVPDEEQLTDDGSERQSEASPDSDENAVGTGGSEEKTNQAAPSDEVPGIPRTTVRITAEVGEMVGADDRDYELGMDDVVTLPAPNAEVLIEKDAAERIE